LIYGNFITEDARTNNSVFGELVEAPLGYYELLKAAFALNGIDINTPDVNKGRKVTFDLHIEGQPLITKGGEKRYLIALENPNHNHFNASREYCKNFTKVFTWNSALFDLSNVVKVLPPHQIRHDHYPSFDERDIFASVINANKNFKIRLFSDLYNERINTIRWYEKNAPQKFALYGRGWDRPPPAYDLIGKIRRSIPSMRYKLFGYKCFPSYKGIIADKGEVLLRSKFSYCYENNRDIPNYITEKIIDSFVYGCVPIYWGADNVLEYIPENCFIDRRKFKATKDVHDFLLSISQEQFSQYQSNIANFLKSENAQRFSFESFVSTVVSAISVDIGIAVV